MGQASIGANRREMASTSVKRHHLSPAPILGDFDSNSMTEHKLPLTPWPVHLMPCTEGYDLIALRRRWNRLFDCNNFATTVRKEMYNVARKADQGNNHTNVRTNGEQTKGVRKSQSLEAPKHQKWYVRSFIVPPLRFAYAL